MLFRQSGRDQVREDLRKDKLSMRPGGPYGPPGPGGPGPGWAPLPPGPVWSPGPGGHFWGCNIFGLFFLLLLLCPVLLLPSTGLLWPVVCSVVGARQTARSPSEPQVILLDEGTDF